MSLEGSYRVLSVVDTVNLKQVVVDPLSGSREKRVLGHYEQSVSAEVIQSAEIIQSRIAELTSAFHRVEMTSNNKNFVVATFLGKFRFTPVAAV